MIRHTFFRSHLATSLIAQSSRYSSTHSSFPSSSSSSSSFSTSSSTSTSNTGTLTNAPPKPTISDPLTPDALRDLLSRPSWSVTSLLEADSPNPSPSPRSSSTADSSSKSSPETSRITPSQLRHLLRLSALPEPRTPEEEKSMIDTLESQLHFVRKVQQLDTTGVEPLVAIRDERKAARKEQEVTVDKVKRYLDREVQVGYYKRIVRRKDVDAKGKGKEGEGEGEKEEVTEEEMQRKQDMDWDPLERAPDKVGRFIRVNTEQR